MVDDCCAQKWGTKSRRSYWACIPRPLSQGWAASEIFSGSWYPAHIVLSSHGQQFNKYANSSSMVYSSFIVLWTPNVLNVCYIPQIFIHSSISSLQYSQRYQSWYHGSEASHQTTPVIPNGFIISWGFPQCLWVSLGHLVASCLFSMWSLCALQILLPSVPRRKVLKDGRYSDARQRLYPGCLLVQCVLNREVYNFIRSVPGVWDFFGTRANTRSVYTF